MTALPYTRDAGFGASPCLGLIVLRTDETIESDFRRLIPDPGIARYVSRIPSETQVTPDALARMKDALPVAAALLPRPLTYDVIGYGCTSASTIIGSPVVAEFVRKGARATHVTDPLRAVRAAFSALAVQRLGFLSPYAAPVSQTMRATLEQDGLDIVSFASFDEENDEQVARIDGPSIRNAVHHIANAAPCDAIFLSCTNLRAVEEIPTLERDLQIPIITSNQALAWHMLHLAGLPCENPSFGALGQSAAAGSG